jgi:hypothetical protein
MEEQNNKEMEEQNNKEMEEQYNQKMDEEYVKAFDDIYEIRQYMSDSQYLNINTILHKLIRKNTELINQNNDIIEENYDLIDKNRKLYADNNHLEIKYDKLFNENKDLHKKIIELKSNQNKNSKINPEEKSENITFTYDDDDRKKCHCMSRWCFSDTSDRSVSDYRTYFCFDTMENLKECDNFKELYKRYPLIINLFERTDELFTDEQKYQDYDKDYITMITKIFLVYVEKMKRSYDKTIVALVMYDFIIRNIKFLTDHNTYARIVLSKFEDMMNETIFISITENYNINHQKWYDILKDAAKN